MKLFVKLIILGYLLQSCSAKKKTNLSSIEGQPNFLFILVDDLGIKDLGYLGSKFHQTPHIDAFASESINFTQGYATSRVCSPSRASIMTGKFTARHGITDWIGAKTGKDWLSLQRSDKLLPAAYTQGLSDDEITIAEVLNNHHYNTFFAGKWHLGKTLPTDHGFNYNQGGWDKGSPVGGYFSPFKNPHLKDQMQGENLTMRLAQETIQFINQNKKQPFFAFLSFYAVHGPIQTTKEKWSSYRDKAERDGFAKSSFIMEDKLPIRQTQDNPVYGGLVESVDDAVGEVLHHLKTSGLYDNTIIIFTSDNGGVASGDAYSTSNLPYKGGKGYQWEGGIRTPYLIHVPGNISNRRVDYPVTGADFYPTILEYANIPLNKNQHKDGISLKPIIEFNKLPKLRPLYWHYPHYGNQGGDPSSVIREGKWKLIHYYETEKNQLYNLEIDPFEQEDVAKESPEITNTLYAKLSNWLKEVDALSPEKDTIFNNEKRQAYDHNIKLHLLPKLEAKRKAMHSKNFEPNKNWWSSKKNKE